MKSFKIILILDQTKRVEHDFGALRDCSKDIETFHKNYTDFRKDQWFSMAILSGNFASIWAILLVLVFCKKIRLFDKTIRGDIMGCWAESKGF